MHQVIGSYVQEDHINKSEDYDTNVGVAVRIDKFSDSSIDLYIRCFTKTDSWNEMLKVKERLAIKIKENVILFCLILFIKNNMAYTNIIKIKC